MRCINDPLQAHRLVWSSQNEVPFRPIEPHNRLCRAYSLKFLLTRVIKGHRDRYVFLMYRAPLEYWLIGNEEKRRGTETREEKKYAWNRGHEVTLNVFEDVRLAPRSYREYIEEIC